MSVAGLTTVGEFLFRWRGAIGFAAFCVALVLGRPVYESCFLGMPLILLGLAVRFWASGYIGIEGRAREIRASRMISSGPYRLLRHPLYIGNSLLVCGMLVAMRPPLWLGVAVLAGFAVEYAAIVVAEEATLKGLKRPKSKVGSRESGVESGESFQLARALCEWRTWVVTGAAWGLALAKAIAL